MKYELVYVNGGLTTFVLTLAEYTHFLTEYGWALDRNLPILLIRFRSHEV